MSHEMRVASGEMEAVQAAVEFVPYDMPEVVVVHGPSASGNDIFTVIQSTSIINAPYTIRTFVDTHPRENVHNDELRQRAFSAAHLFIEQSLFYEGSDDSELAERSQSFSSAPHTTWLFEGDSLHTLLSAAGHNRLALVHLSRLATQNEGMRR